MRNPSARTRRASAGRATALAAALAVAPNASADAPPSAPPGGAEVELRAVAAPLPVVLDALAATLGVELRLDAPLVASPPLVTETLRGDAGDALRRLVERFGLALFVDGRTVWIDSPGYRHVHAVALGSRDAAAVASVVEEDLAVAGGRVERVGDELVLSGPRAAVVEAVRSVARASARFPARSGDGEPDAPPGLGAAAPSVPTTPAVRIPYAFSVPLPAGAPFALRPAPTASADGSLAELPAARVGGRVVAPAAPATPATVRPELPRRIRDVRDIPGFDSEYRER